MFIPMFTALIFLTLPMTNAQTTSHYGAKIGDSGANLVGYDLTMYSPQNQKAYANMMPLDFNITWKPVGVSLFFNWTFTGIYSCRIDNKPPVNIESNQSESDFFGYNAPSGSNFKYNPSFSYLLEISILTDGQHSIVVDAAMNYNMSGHLAQIYEESSSPIFFWVENSASSSALAVPEFPSSMILAFFVIVAYFAVSVRQRKL